MSERSQDTDRQVGLRLKDDLVKERLAERIPHRLYESDCTCVLSQTRHLLLVCSSS
jgi:hypothetical protein